MGNIIVGALVFAALALAALRLARQARKNKTSGGCANCPGCG
jgi:hypothetical protein